MTRSRWLWAGSIVAALCVGALAGALWWGRPAPPQASPPPAPSGPESPPPPTAQPDEPPFLQIEGTRLSGSDPQGRRVWDIRAKTLEVDRSRQRIVLTLVTGQFYGGGKAMLQFAAPGAVFDVTSKDVELSGGVVARAQDGRTLRAARVRYAAGEQALLASGDVVLTQPGVSIRADELRTDPGFAQTKFSGNIVVRVTE